MPWPPGRTMTARWPAWRVRASPVLRGLVYALALEDLAEAALFRPAWEHTEGVDGCVSREVAPDAAYDAAATVALPRRRTASSRPLASQAAMAWCRRCGLRCGTGGRLVVAGRSRVPMLRGCRRQRQAGENRPGRPAAQVPRSLGPARHRASDCRSVCSSVSTLRSGWARRATSCAQAAISESESYSGSPPRPARPPRWHRSVHL